MLNLCRAGRGRPVSLILHAIAGLLDADAPLDGSLDFDYSLPAHAIEILSAAIAILSIAAFAIPSLSRPTGALLRGLAWPLIALARLCSGPLGLLERRAFKRYCVSGLWFGASITAGYVAPAPINWIACFVSILIPLVVITAWNLNEEQREAIARKLSTEDPDTLPDLRDEAVIASLCLFGSFGLLAYILSPVLRHFVGPDQKSPLIWTLFAVDQFLHALIFDILETLDWKGYSQIGLPDGISPEHLTAERVFVAVLRAVFSLVVINTVLSMVQINRSIDDAITAFRRDPSAVAALGERAWQALGRRRRRQSSAWRRAAKRLRARLGLAAKGATGVAREDQPWDAPPSAVSALRQVIKSTDAEEARSSILAAGQLGLRELAGEISMRLRSATEDGIRAAAVVSLTLLGATEAIAAAVRWAESDDIRISILDLVVKRATTLKYEGRTDLARQAYRACIDMADDLVRRSPDNGKLSRIWHWARLGLVDLSAGTYSSDEEIRYAEEAVASFRTCKPVDANDTTTRDLASGLLRIGDLKYRSSDFRGALLAYQESAELFREIALVRFDTSTAHDLSVGLEKVGDACANLSEWDKALATYGESLEIVRRNPRDADSERPGGDLPTVLNKVAGVLVTLGHRSRARALFEESLKLRREAVAAGTGILGKRELFVSLCHMGDVELSLGEPENAQKLFEEALEIAEQNVQFDASPERQRDLSVAIDRLADALWRKGELRTAAALYERSLALTRYLAVRERNERMLRDLSVDLDRICGIRLALGDKAGARVAVDESLQLATQIARRDRRPETLRDLSVTLLRAGEVRVQLNEMEVAKSCFDACLSIRRRLAESDATPQSQRDLAVILMALGDWHAIGDRDAAASGFYRESVSLRRQLLTDDPSLERMRDLSAALDRIGEVQSTAGNIEAALAAHEESLALARKIRARDSTPQARRDLAISLIHICRDYTLAADGPGARKVLEEAIEILTALHDEAPSSRTQADLDFARRYLEIAAKLA